MAGLSDWRSRASGGGWSSYRPRTNNRPRQSSQAARTQSQAGAFAVPQSEQYASGGYGSPLHGEWMRTFTPQGSGLPSTTSAYQQFWRDTGGGRGTGMAPAAPLYNPGGGGRGYGGGGGGGGGAAAPQLTQAMLDQMLKVLGAQGPTLNYTPVNLPDFRGTNLAAFNPAPYVQAQQQLQQGAAADISAAQAGGQRATQALNANYANPYANARVSAAPAAQEVGAGLQATAGGGGAQTQEAQNANVAAASDQASFQNLLNVLAATDQAAQSSRLNQVALDQNTAANSIRAQQRGLQGGIGMARTQAANQWAQADAERRYQNSLMQQQWNREEMMRNQDLRNQATQANWQQRNQTIDTRIQPLLQLLSTPGAMPANLNLGGIQQLLAGWRR